MKPGQGEGILTQMMANNSMHFDTLAKHSTLNGEEYTAMLSVLVKEFQAPLPVDTNTLRADFQVECIELQSGIQLKNPIMSVYQTFIRPLLREGNVLRFTVKPY